MFKKLLIAAVIVLGLIYGTGNDLSSVKRSILGSSGENARSLTGGDNGGWGDGSGY